jgi:hypothetical protein
MGKEKVGKRKIGKKKISLLAEGSRCDIFNAAHRGHCDGIKSATDRDQEHGYQLRIPDLAPIASLPQALSSGGCFALLCIFLFLQRRAVA